MAYFRYGFQGVILLILLLNSTLRYTSFPFIYRLDVRSPSHLVEKLEVIIEQFLKTKKQNIEISEINYAFCSILR